MKKTLVFYSFFFLALMILQRGSGFLTKIVLANTITPYEYGIITLVALSLPSMFQLITNLNFYQILSHSQEGRKYLGFTLFCSILIVILLSVFLFFFNKEFFGYINLPEEGWNLFYITTVISLFFISIVIDFQGLFAGLKKYSLPGIIMTLPTIIRLIAVVVITFLGISSFQLIIVIFAVSNVFPLVFILASRQYRVFFSEITNIAIPTKYMMVFGFSILIITSISSIGQYIIKLVISHNLGIEWQGYYDVSATLTAIMIFALGTMQYLAIPEATNPDKNAMHELGGLKDVTRALFALMVFFLLLLFFYAEFFVGILFSSDYLIASKYAYILGIGYIFLFIQSFLANLNIAHAKTMKEYSVMTIIPLIVIPLFFFLTEYLIIYFQQLGYDNGFIGAYLSYTILVGIVMLLTIIISKDRSPLKILFSKIEVLVSAFFITFFVLYAIQFSPFLGIGIASLIFCGVIFLFGYVPKAMFLDLFRGLKKQN